MDEEKGRPGKVDVGVDVAERGGFVAVRRTRSAGCGPKDAWAIKVLGPRHRGARRACVVCGHSAAMPRATQPCRR
jgi:hypothetical protein